MTTLEDYSGSPLHVRVALTKIRAGEPLTTWDALAVARILEQVLAGYDARKDLGIEPKRGALPTERSKHVGMAAHYWTIYSREKEKGWRHAAHAVAKVWGGTEKGAYKIALEHKDDGLKEASEMTLDQILAFASIRAGL